MPESVAHGEFILGGIAEMNFTLDILLGGDENGLGEFFVIAGDFNLLAVLGHLLEVIVERSDS